MLAARRRRFTQLGLPHRRKGSVPSLPGRGGELGNPSGFEDLDLVEHTCPLEGISIQLFIERHSTPGIDPSQDRMTPRLLGSLKRDPTAIEEMFHARHGGNRAKC